MTSLEEAYPYSSNADPTVLKRNASPTYMSSDYGRPVPRSENRNTHEGLNGNAIKTHHRTDTAGSTSSRGPPRRVRTYSQSNIYDGPFQNGRLTGGNGSVNGLPTPGPSRSTSPLYQQQAQGRISDIKPTRIPIVVRGRTPSTSSHGHGVHNGRNSDVSRNGARPSSPTPLGTQPELWAVEESEHLQIIHARLFLSLVANDSGIINETAPFEASPAGSAISSQYQHGHSHEESAAAAAPARKSTDSEERPFEHWYRGDIYRNGGVGEITCRRKNKRCWTLRIMDTDMGGPSHLRRTHRPYEGGLQSRTSLCGERGPTASQVLEHA